MRASARIPASSVVVLTTPERSPLYRAVLGDGLDEHLDPLATSPLDLFMCTCAGSGCRLIIIDEAHFLSASDMIEGICAFVDDGWQGRDAPRLVIVCSERSEGDLVLAFLASHCGIYDIVFDCDGPELAARIADVVAAPRGRRDVSRIARRGQKVWRLATIGDVDAAGEDAVGEGPAVGDDAAGGGPAVEEPLARELPEGAEVEDVQVEPDGEGALDIHIRLKLK